MTEETTRPRREVILVPNVGRESNLRAASRAAQLLREAGIQVRQVVLRDDHGALANDAVLSQIETVSGYGPEADTAELVLVLGGDGTFLHAAEIARAADLPVLGINLGHVGFLAEWEAESLEEAIRCVIAKDYRIEERMTVDVAVYGPDSEKLGDDWALNEVSVEKLNSRGVLDAILEVDGRPVSAFGCDGVLVSTPTGSTAYAFSAGGPVLWPELDAILVVPNNAHALFAKPLVVSPSSVVAVESRAESYPANALMDGYRTIEMPPGSRVEVSKGKQSVRWVRLDDRPFADRLVRKFKLPVKGWRGPERIHHEENE